MELATKDIVVTTYDTLNSDDGYWRNKFYKNASNLGKDYSSPCNHIRWWRVIVDESHNIKGDTKNSLSCQKLVAENRWCVTGTPINNSVDDLRNQLKFCR